MDDNKIQASADLAEYANNLREIQESIKACARPSYLLKPALSLNARTNKWEAVYFSITARGDSPAEAYEAFDIAWAGSRKSVPGSVDSTDVAAQRYENLSRAWLDVLAALKVQVEPGVLIQEMRELAVNAIMRLGEELDRAEQRMHERDKLQALWTSQLEQERATAAQILEQAKNDAVRWESLYKEDLGALCSFVGVPEEHATLRTVADAAKKLRLERDDLLSEVQAVQSSEGMAEIVKTLNARQAELEKGRKLYKALLGILSLTDDQAGGAHESIISNVRQLKETTKPAPTMTVQRSITAMGRSELIQRIGELETLIIEQESSEERSTARMQKALETAQREHVTAQEQIESLTTQVLERGNEINQLKRELSSRDFTIMNGREHVEGMRKENERLEKAARPLAYIRAICEARGEDNSIEVEELLALLDAEQPPLQTIKYDAPTEEAPLEMSEALLEFVDELNPNEPYHADYIRSAVLAILQGNEPLDKSEFGEAPTDPLRVVTHVRDAVEKLDDGAMYDGDEIKTMFEHILAGKCARIPDPGSEQAWEPGIPEQTAGREQRSKELPPLEGIVVNAPPGKDDRGAVERMKRTLGNPIVSAQPLVPAEVLVYLNGVLSPRAIIQEVVRAGQGRFLHTLQLPVRFTNDSEVTLLVYLNGQLWRSMVKVAISYEPNEQIPLGLLLPAVVE